MKTFIIIFFILDFFNRGVGPSNNSQEASEKLISLKEELKILDEHEKELDLHTCWAKQSIKNVECDSTVKRFSYIRYEDIKDTFDDAFILAIHAPKETELNMPKIENVRALFII